MQEFLVHLFVVAPAIGWVTSSKRKWNKDTQIIGVLMALAILALDFNICQYSRKPNHYEMLGLPIIASQREIKTAYRARAMTHHPDKTDDQEKIALFTKIKEAYEVLSVSAKKQMYEKFGDYDSTADHQTILNSAWDFILIAIYQYMIPFMFGFLYTMGVGNADARSFFSIFSFGAMALEILFRFHPQANDLMSFVPIFGGILPFERANFLLNLLPVVLCFCLNLSDFLSSDLSEVFQYTYYKVLTQKMLHMGRLNQFMKKVEAEVAELEAELIQKGIDPANVSIQEIERISAISDAKNVKRIFNVLRNDSADVEKVEHMENYWQRIRRRSSAPHNWERATATADCVKDTFLAVLEDDGLLNCLEPGFVPSREECIGKKWDSGYGRSFTQYLNELFDDTVDASKFSIGSIVFFTMLIYQVLFTNEFSM